MVAKVIENSIATVDGCPLVDSDVKRFWSKVRKKSPSDCWIWKGTRSRDGYGMFSYDATNIGITGKSLRSHRISYALHHKKSVFKGLILHHCDTPLCVNPKHLFCGSPKDNTSDMINKNRHRGNLRLTQIQVEEICKLYETTDLSLKDIGEKFGIVRVNVSKIIKGNHRFNTIPRNRSIPVRNKTIGEGHGMSKLTSIQVHQIRKKYNSGGQVTQLARKFGVTRQAISAIVKNKIWKMVK